MQKYFHQTDVSMSRHGWIEKEEANKVKPFAPSVALVLMAGFCSFFSTVLSLLSQVPLTDLENNVQKGGKTKSRYS